MRLLTKGSLTLMFGLGLIQADTTLTIQNGWNLISTPTAIAISSDYFTNSNVWAYKKNGWDFNPTNIDYGSGFWVNSTTTQPVTFKGESYKQSFENLSKGWNLLGTGEDMIVPDIFSILWKFDGSKWSSFKNSASIKAGEGFWIYLNQATGSSSNFDYSPYITKSSKSTKDISIAQSENKSYHDSEDYYTYNDSDIVTINLSSKTVDKSEVATINDNNITITSGGVYKITGSTSNTQLVIDSSEIVKLILSEVSITNENLAPIYIANAKKSIIKLESTNTLSDSVNNTQDATLFSRDDLTIYGDGTLNINSNKNDGVRSNDGLVIKSGTINVISNDDGIKGNDYVVIKSGNITVNSIGDGLKSDNNDSDKGYILIENGTLNITSKGDTIKAETDLLINSGDLILKSGGGSNTALTSDSSAKALKSGVSIVIDGGTFNISSADDSIHTNGEIYINSGTFNISSGDDAIHGDKSIEINGGSFVISKSYEGIESNTTTINNGYIQITSSDDGINVAGGTDGSGFMNPMGNKDPNQPQGDRNQTKPNDFNNTRPQPNDFNGTAPSDFNNTNPRPMDFNSTQQPQNSNQMNGNENYHLYINGGFITVNSGGDGLDSNGYMNMSGGIVLVNGPIDNGNGAIDYDSEFKISGGILVAVGSSGMAQAPSTSSTQNSLLTNFSTSQKAGDIINIQNSSGESLLTFVAQKNYQSLVFSSPKLTTGATYNIYSGGSSDGVNTHGFYQDGTYTQGSKLNSFTVSNSVTTLR